MDCVQDLGGGQTMWFAYCNKAIEAHVGLRGIKFGCSTQKPWDDPDIKIVSPLKQL